ncbi:alginate export family protein [Gilvibacter sediminis]|uniref:alginate export family protein n=1 Tax=Gilvibacter sediminis TaxID=379071 RepID=UPI00235106AE|nr:alginate export family protein [Gilvibacter sediminis]MDC7997998.1 alginate export family protein [Gilvibacter sediminis]
MNYKCILFSFLLVIGGKAYSQDSEFLMLYESEGIKVQGYLQFGVNAVAETNLFWNLADVPELDYDSDTQWLESYAKPGLGFTVPVGKSKFYGRVSAVWSGTLGTDAFDEGDTGRFTLEESHIGYLFAINEHSSLDLSLGGRELKLGTGMLIANGGVSGFERGALKFGPRKAWEMSAIGHYNNKNFNARAFYLDPNELPSNDTKNEIVGFDANWTANPNKFFGFSYLNVIRSEAPYPQAAPGGDGPPEIIAGGREDLNALSFYGKTYPFKGKLKDFFTALDFAYQWNQRLDLNAWGGRAQLGYDFKKLKWTPTLMATYQIFSGDDPNTPGLERFDPLYYEGSPSAWSTGSKSSMVFINSNLRSFMLSLRVMPSQKDILTLRYANIAAQQLRSPIQFGQAARVEFSDGIPTVVSGVTEANLANDIFLEYNRVVSRNLFVNAGFAFSFAGDGINNIVGDTSVWSGAFVNVVFNY